MPILQTPVVSHSSPVLQ